MRISLFGYGKTTQAIAARVRCFVYDDAFNNVSIDEWGNTLCPSVMFDANNSDLEIPSPGIMPTHPLIQKAKNLCSEYDYFKDIMPPSIWISGTNGKSTTTEMTHMLFKHEGAQMGGNIGIPLADLNPTSPLWILETSSFALHYTCHAYPLLYLLLPIEDDHISWHKSFEEYRSCKLSPIARMESCGTVVLPSSLVSYLPNHVCKVIEYDSTQHLAEIFGIDMTNLPFFEPFLQDSLLALAAHKILRSNLPYNLISTYTTGEHRQQEARDVQGRLWVNDSKATNVDATLKALKRYQHYKIYLIIGGDDKGANLVPLFESLKQFDVELYAIGRNEQQLCILAEQFNIACIACGCLQNAVERISLKLTVHDVALLSPAAASLDQFTSYAQRGKQFLKYANAIA